MSRKTGRLRRNRIGTSGFSLVELVVAIALIGVVSSIGVSIFMKMSTLWGNAQLRTRLDARAENAFDRMRRDLADLMPSSVAGCALVGTEGQYVDEERFWGTELAADTLLFPMRTGEEQTGNGVLIQYELDRSLCELVISTGPLSGGAPTERRAVVAEGVLQFNVEYAGGTEPGWKRSWTSPEMPQALRVTLVVMDLDRPHEQAVRRAVFPVHVQ